MSKPEEHWTVSLPHMMHLHRSERHELSNQWRKVLRDAGYKTDTYFPIEQREAADQLAARIKQDTGVSMVVERGTFL